MFGIIGWHFEQVVTSCRNDKEDRKDLSLGLLGLHSSLVVRTPKSGSWGLLGSILSLVVEAVVGTDLVFGIGFGLGGVC